MDMQFIQHHLWWGRGGEGEEKENMISTAYDGIIS
jgi:hypothetical protein